MIRLLLALAIALLAGCATTPSYTYYYGDGPEGAVDASGDYYAGAAPSVYVGSYGGYGYGWGGYHACPYPYAFGACSPYSWGLGYAGWGYPGWAMGYPGWGYGYGGWWGGYPWVYHVPHRGPRRDEGMIERERVRQAGYTRDPAGTSGWVSLPDANAATGERGFNRSQAPAYRERSTISAPPEARRVQRAPMWDNDGRTGRVIGPSSAPAAMPRPQPRIQAPPPMRSAPAPAVRSAPPPAPRFESAPRGKRD